MASRYIRSVKTQEEETPQPKEMTAGDAARHAAALGLRVAGPWVGTLAGGALGTMAAPGPGTAAGAAGGGAAGGAISEWLAELLEGGSDNVNTGRIALSGGLGAIPGSWMVRAGKPIASAGLGAGIGYVGTAGNKLAMGEEPERALNPGEWSKSELVLGPILGGGFGAALGKITHGSAPKATPEVFEVDTHPLSYSKSVGGAISQSKKRIPGTGQAIDIDINSMAEPAPKQTTPVMGAPAEASGRVSKVIAKEEKAAVKAIKDKEKILSNTFKSALQRKEGTAVAEARDLQRRYIQDARNLAAKEKFIGKEQAQEAKNLAQGEKFVEKAFKEEAKLSKQEAAQAKVDEFMRRGDLETGEPSLTEATSVEMPAGRQTLRQTTRIKPPAPPDVEGTPVTSGNPLSPDVAKHNLFPTEREALIAATEHGATVKRLGRGKYKLVFPGEEGPAAAPVAPPTAPKGPKPTGGVAKALEAARPFNTLSKAEQGRVTQIVRKAMDEGFTGDLEQLGDEVASRLSAIKDSQDLMRDSGTSSDALLKAIRGAGGLSERLEGKGGLAGDLKWLKEHFNKPGQMGEGRSAVGLFTKKGLSVDKMLEALKQENGRFTYIKGPNDLIAALRKASEYTTGAKSTAALNELEQSLNPGWWKKTPDVEVGDYTGVTPPVEAPLTVEEFAKALSKEGEKPIAEVPFALQPEAASAKPVESVLKPSEPTQGVIPAKLFKSPLEAAGEHYGAIKKAAKAGEVPEEGRAVAGRAAARINRETLDRLPKQEKPAAPIAEQATKELDSNDLTQMAPAEQDKALADLVNKFKGQKGAVSNETLIRLGLGSAGALAGAAATPDDPITGALLGAGAGFFAPSVARALITRAASTPGMPPATMEEIGEKVKDTTKTFLSILPDYYRANLLLSIPNLPINMWVGPWGSSILAATTDAFQGIAFGDAAAREKGLAALKLFLNPTKFPKAWSTGLAEAKERIAMSSERAEGLGTTGPEWFRRYTEMPASGLTAGDVAARNLLMEAGYSEAEARRITLTSEPYTAWGRGISAGKKGAQTEGGKKSVITNIMLPFYKTRVNQLEQSLERAPVLGIIAQFAKDTPDPNIAIAAQQVMGTGISFISFMLGTVVPPPDRALGPADPNRMFYKFLSNFGGQYGAVVTAAFAAGQALQQGNSMSGALATDISLGAPLPSSQPIWDMYTNYRALAEGDRELKLPAGVIPGVLSPNTPINIPGGVESMIDLMSPPQNQRPTRSRYIRRARRQQ